MLHGAGHRRFAFIGGPEEASTHIDRYRGFADPARSGPAPLIETGPSRMTADTGAGMRLFARRDRPDAIFCANDVLAISALDAPGARQATGCGVSARRLDHRLSKGADGNTREPATT
ncbi:MAG: substrate-binding domain-containing protein [Betaproteobacteria bacterium]|nr:substrate-binding domain-containing protein [Betaproteobacteria bacterium]